MSVHYACIAYKDTLLVHRGKTDKLEKQYSTEIQGVLKPFLDKDNMRQTAQQGDNIFYCLLHKQLTFICFCDTGVSKQQAYNMLQDVEETFTSKYVMATIKTSPRLAMDREFGQILGQKMTSVKQYGTKLTELTAVIEETKALALDNIQAIMKRASKLDDIQVDAADLKENAAGFLDQTEQLKKEMRCKRIATIASVCGGVAIVIVIIVGFSTKWFGLAK